MSKAMRLLQHKVHVREKPFVRWVDIGVHRDDVEADRWIRSHGGDHEVFRTRSPRNPYHDRNPHKEVRP